MPGTGLPPNLEPMGAVAVDSLPPDDQRWGYEVKWDGVRALAYVEAGRARLQSRTMKDITDLYPELAVLGRDLDGVVLDGEVVAPDESGRPRFERLQQRISLTPGLPVARRAADIPVSYVAFDLLHQGGRPLLDVPYAERRELLAGLPLPEEVARAPRHHVGQGAALLEASRARGLEGLVAKRLDGPYLPGRRSRLWLKIKNFRRQELVIGGWLPGSGGRVGALGALLVGHHAEGGLRYAGRVGTGFTEAERARLKGRLEALERRSSPFASDRALPPDVGRMARFVEPVLVAEVAFSEWTSAGTLRAPSYKGLRDDVDAERVVREPEPPA